MSNAIDVTKEFVREDMKDISNKLTSITFSNSPGISISKEDTDLIKPNKVTDELDVSITNVLNSYNDKYGTKFKYEDFKTSIITATNINSNEKEIRRIINSEIINNATDILVTKSILVISKVISDQLDRIPKMALELDGETVSIISEIFGWIDKLEEIKKRYQLFDVDSKIKDMLTGKTSANINRSQEERQVIELLKKSLLENK
jgi:hypothetical protein